MLNLERTEIQGAASLKIQFKKEVNFEGQKLYSNKRK